MPHRPAKQRIDRQVQGLSFDIPQRQFQSSECFDQAGIMCIQQGTDFREASAATIINIGWIHADQPRRKLVRHDINLFNSGDFSPSNNPVIGVNLDDSFGCTQIQPRRPPIASDKGKINFVNQDVRNLHRRLTIARLAAIG